MPDDQTQHLPPVVAVVGATAAGKTTLSLDLAEALDGEVVNTDAFQLYRGMDIGTAKLPVAERRGVPHHLLDLLEVTETATVAEFQRWARTAIAEIRGRGRTPVLVGGSALYTRAVLDEFDFPGTDPGLRARLQAELDEHGTAVMHARLAEVDRAAAAHIEPANGRRIVRALEVVTLTGAPFRATLPPPTYAVEGAVQVGVGIDRPTLDTRIARRVALMAEQGLVEEVRTLAARGLAEGLTASRALGYQQVLAHLEGRCTEAEALEQTVAGTRRFVRRQESWFLKDRRVTWVPHDAPDRVTRALDAVRRSGRMGP
ncbi:MAG: tRNA (adenosine(37)-N6)-dimethylallyltransferase MiaA [Nocardioides sp.]|nr:tRNA (adenosine(37)-N6)-dimethylallyltransferase MiaA [Nocardioides sp.]